MLHTVGGATMLERAVAATATAATDVHRPVPTTTARLPYSYLPHRHTTRRRHGYSLPPHCPSRRKRFRTSRAVPRARCPAGRDCSTAGAPYYSGLSCCPLLARPWDLQCRQFLSVALHPAPTQEREVAVKQG